MNATVYIVLSREEGDNFGVTGTSFVYEEALESAKNSARILVEDAWNEKRHNLEDYYKSLENNKEVYMEGVGEVQIIERSVKIPGNLLIADRILR